MKRKLKSIAMELSDSDIQEIIRIKKNDDKKTEELRKKRNKLVAELAQIDAQLAKNPGDEKAAIPTKPGSKPAARKNAKKKKSVLKTKPANAKKSVQTQKSAGGKKGKSSRGGLSLAVRAIVAKASNPLKASQIVDALPGVGIPVDDILGMRKRISVILASQGKYFTQVGRGLYELTK